MHLGTSTTCMYISGELGFVASPHQAFAMVRSTPTLSCPSITPTFVHPSIPYISPHLKNGVLPNTSDRGSDFFQAELRGSVVWRSKEGGGSMGKRVSIG